MDDSGTPGERLVTLLEDRARDEAVARLERLRTAAVRDRKPALRSLRRLADDRPHVVAPLSSALTPFLEDDERSVRLTTAKLFVALAQATPEAVVPVVPALADRLADEEEFYYVRARAAEALGYVARHRPDAVCDPETLAELRVGLSFDQPEVKEKLAKALEHVALGDPGRLRHQVPALADHLDDGSDLVRYHLCTALVAVGCEHPDRLTAARDALRERVDDGNDHVKGRAIEALGLLARADALDIEGPTLGEEKADEASFLTDRRRFALGSGGGSVPATDASDEIGTLDGVRATTERAVDAIASPDNDGECPHCGLAVSDDGPPLCPRCGAPY